MASTDLDFRPLDSIDPADYARALKGHLPYSSFNHVSLRCYWPEAHVAIGQQSIGLVITPHKNSCF